MSDSKTAKPEFRRSSRCEAVNCVEVATLHDAAVMRNSTTPQIQISFDAASWRGFVAGVAAGEFDVSRA